MDWLRFTPDMDAKVLYVTILVGPFMETSVRGVDAVCDDLYPILDQIQTLCLEKGLTQVCSTDLSDMTLKKIKPLVMMKIIWKVYEHTKDNIMLSRCEVSGGGSFIETLLGAVRGLLPPFMRNMITLIPNQNQSDNQGNDDIEFLESIPDEII